MRLRHDYLNQTTCIWFTTQKTRRIKLPKPKYFIRSLMKNYFARLPASVARYSPATIGQGEPPAQSLFWTTCLCGARPICRTFASQVVNLTPKSHHFYPKKSSLFPQKWWLGDENCRRKIKHESENGVCQAKSKERTPCFYSGTPAAPSKISGKNTDCLPTISYFCAQTCRLISPTTLKKNHYG